MIPATAAFTGAVLVLGAAWLGGRTFRRPSALPVAPTFRAVGVAPVPGRSRIDVASHALRRRITPYQAQHRGEGRASRREAKIRSDVPNGVHRSGVAWAELDRQRARFSALIRGGAR